MTLPTHLVHGPDDAPPVVLLNGGMMTHAGWLPIASRLAEHFTVLRFDFRGQLLSPPSPSAPAPGDLAGHAADVEALLDARGWDDAHLVGTSFGGLVALELASTRPRRVRSLTLVAVADHETPTFRRGSDTSRRILAQVAEAVDGPEENDQGNGEEGGEEGGEAASAAREAFHEHLMDHVFSAEYVTENAEELMVRKAQLGQVPAYWFAGVDSLIAMLEGFDLRPRLGSVTCPARVLTAADDKVMPPDDSAAMARALGAEHVVHPASGHAVVTEDPAWVAERCLEFLHDLEGRPES